MIWNNHIITRRICLPLTWLFFINHSLFWLAPKQFCRHHLKRSLNCFRLSLSITITIDYFIIVVSIKDFYASGVSWTLNVTVLSFTSTFFYFIYFYELILNKYTPDITQWHYFTNFWIMPILADLGIRDIMTRDVFRGVIFDTVSLTTTR